jgi:hypothetical protein
LEFPEDELEREILLREIEFYGMKEFFGEELKEPEFKGSTILNTTYMNQINKWIESKSKKGWEICYKASKDGFASTDFHRCADNKGENVLVIKDSNGYIFGAYVPQSWTSKGSYTFDTKTFLFSLKSPSNKPTKMPNTGPHISNQYSFYDYSSYGPTFGGGHDLVLFHLLILLVHCRNWLQHGNF